MNEQTIKLFQSKLSDHWATPRDLYNKLDKEFRFDVDPCPLYPTFNGLKIEWHGNIFINPPYSQIEKWLKKGLEELNKGNAKVLVYLVFANTDTKWFHKYIYNKCKIRFIKGRLKFKGKNKKGEWVNNSAMRPSMLCIFKS